MIEEARNKCHKRSDLKGKGLPEPDVLNREGSGGESQVEHLQQPARISTATQRAKVRRLEASVISEPREWAQKEIII